MIAKVLRFIWKWRTRAVLAVVGVGIVLFLSVFNTSSSPKKTNFTFVEHAILHNEASSVTLYDAQHEIDLTLTNGTKYMANYVSDEGANLTTLINQHNVPLNVVGNKSSWIEQNYLIVIFTVLIIGSFVGVPTLFSSGMKKVKDQAIGKTEFLAERPKERFTDVVGAQEAVSEFSLIVDSLQNPKKYEGIKPDRGVLLYGPPGSGKTLLAKAVAGEAGVPFFRLSGAGLGSLWAGATSERIGKFFDAIRKQLTSSEAAAIVFIDELDGIASKRAGSQGVDRDRNTAVTQLLDQISRLFETHPHVVVIGASNRKSELDSAITRVDRLGKHIAMPNPDLAARRQILVLNSTDLGLDSTMLDGVARLTEGLSGSAVARILNEARVIHRLAGAEGNVTNHDFELAALHIAIGTLRKSALTTPHEDAVSAAHESGHSTVAGASKYHQLLTTTTIPVNEAGGSTWAPMIDNHLPTQDSVLWQLAVLMAGREAEKMCLDGQLSTGAAHDIERATEICVQVICSAGFFTDYPLGVDPENWEAHPHAPQVAELVSMLLKKASVLARTTLEENRSFMETVRSQLLAKRILYSDELRLIKQQALTS